MLHLIVQSPIDKAVLLRIGSGDDVVFLHPAVWSALNGHVLQEQLERLMANQCRFYVLRDELEMNGIEIGRLVSGVNVIEYQGLVELSVANKVNKTWR